MSTTKSKRERENFKPILMPKACTISTYIYIYMLGSKVILSLVGWLESSGVKWEGRGQRQAKNKNPSWWW